MAYQLSPVNESDEAISLFEVLSRLGGTGLNCKELWSLCFQCTRILQDINKVGDFFQTLCITPESVAFEIATGQICLLDLYVDPETKYVPPEYEKHGNSEKSHLYSLGWTLIEANGGKFEEESNGLSKLVGCLTARLPEERPTIEEVIDICNSVLQNESSEKICQELFDRAEKNTDNEGFVPVQKRQTLKTEGKEPEAKSHEDAKENERDATRPLAEKPVLAKKPCLKNKNGVKSANKKKKATVSFSEANSLINLSITYHSSDENDGENYQNSNSCQDEVNERQAKPEVPGSEDNGPEIRNVKFETCIPQDFQDGSQSKFQESNVDEISVQTSGTGEGIFGNSLVTGNSYAKCQNSFQCNSYGNKNSRQLIKCLDNVKTDCSISKTHHDEEFFKDAKCSNCCTFELISESSNMDVQSKNSGTKKWQISEDEELQREYNLRWLDNQRITRNNDMGKMPDSEMIERLDSANENEFLEQMDGDISSERSSVELVPLGHANRSVLWNFGHESPSTNGQESQNRNGNLVDLILGSRSDECFNGHKVTSITRDEMVPVFSGNAKGSNLNEKVPKKTNGTKSEAILSNKEIKATNHNNNNCTDLQIDEDDDTSSLLGEIKKAKSFQGETAKQKHNRIKEMKATTLQDIIDVTGLYFDETELWALCRESLLLINKVKDIPSYLSLDVVAIQPKGHLLFLDPPPQKSTDISFVAPEIQRQDKITEKTGIFGLGMVLCLAAGWKKSGPVANLGMSDIMKDLLEDMISSEESHRPTTNCIYELCEAHEKSALYSSQNICQSLYEECVENLMENMDERDETGCTGNLGKNDETFYPERKENEKKTLKESEENCVGASNQKSAFTAVVNKHLEFPEGENSQNIPTVLNSPATHFKPIILNESWDQTQKAQSAKERMQWEIKDTINRDPEKSPQKPMASLGKRSGSNTETFVSASRRVVEKLRQLEEVYTKQTSKGNLSKPSNKLSESEKSEPAAKEKPSLQVEQGKEPSCLTVQKDQTLGKKEVEELAEIILNKLQEKQSTFGQFSTLGLFGWNDLSLNKSQSKSQVPLMVMPTQRVMTVPFVNAPYPPMMNNGQCAEEVHISSKFPAKEPPCPHCLYSSSPSASQSETSSCQSDPNCCDSLEDDEEPQVPVDNFQELRHHSDFKRCSYTRCSLCLSHGRRAQDLVHKLRSRRTKKPKEVKQFKCHCLNNKKWSSEASLPRSQEQYPKAESWSGHFDMPLKSGPFHCNSEGCPRNKKEFEFPLQPFSQKQNLSKSRPENLCNQETSGFENSDKNSFLRSISEPNHSNDKRLCHSPGYQSKSLDFEVTPYQKHLLYHCECNTFIDNDQQGFSSSSTPNLTPEEIPVSLSDGNKDLGMYEVIISEDQLKLQNGRQYNSERDANSLKVKQFGDIAQGAADSNVIPSNDGHSCLSYKNCHKNCEEICYKCPKAKTSLNSEKENSDSQEVFLKTLCSSQTISEGTIKQLHLIFKIMKIIQRHMEPHELERNPDENFVMGAGIASLKGLCWEKFQNTLTTIYPNYEWNEKCQQEIFDIINSTKEAKNSLKLDSELKSSSHLPGNDALDQTFTLASCTNSETSLCLKDQILGNSIPEFHDSKESLVNGKILASSELTTKHAFEANPIRDIKGLSFDQGDVTVPLPKPAEESQFQLIKKNNDDSKELSKKKSKERHDSEKRNILIRSNAIEEDNGKNVTDSGFLDEPGTKNCANVAEKNPELELVEKNIVQSSFLERETFFSSTSSLEKEELGEGQNSLIDSKTSINVDCVMQKQEFLTEAAKKDKVSRHSSVMKRYRSYQESGSLLKVGIIPSSEADSDFGPSHSGSTEDGNGADEDETPTCSSDLASSPTSELSLDGDDQFSESGKTVCQEAPFLSNEVSVNSFDFSGPRKNSVSIPVLNDDSRVVYHSADLVRYSDNTDVMTFLKGIDKSDFASLNTRLKILQQQLMLESKEWQKMNRLYQNLQNKETWNKSNKLQMTRVSNDLKECEETLNCLQLCRQHLELLIVSKCSIPHDLVHSLTMCDCTKPLELIPQKDNPHLHYHTISATENTTGTDTYVLNAGFPRALFANLYTQSALVEGIIHQFFYCYRYFSSPQQLFSFMTSTYTASKRCLQSEQASIVQERTLLLLLWWIKDYYNIDFHGNSKLCKMAQEFIQELPEDEKRVSDIKTVWDIHISGHSQELMSTASKQSLVYTVTCPTKKNRMSSLSASDWDLRPSFSCDTSLPIKSKDWPVDHMSPTHNSKSSPQRSFFSFNDHSAEVLTEQLTLIEQELFQRVHPVLFLNSKYNGFNTSLTIPGWNNPRSIRNKQNSATNLFVSEIVPHCSSVETQIRHAHQISHWVGAELISASSSRAQVSLLTKFLNIALCCTKIQNFATGMAILDGLENALVRQMPTWKELNMKSINIFTKLKTFKNSDSIGMSTEKPPMEKICHPVIPSILPYLLNVQQCEIGSFTLTNGMHKWTKMRHITRAIDPLRVFRQYKYPFKPIPYLQNFLQQRIEQTCHQDLNILARERSSFDDKLSFPVQGKKNFERVMKRIRDKLKTNK